MTISDEATEAAALAIRRSVSPIQASIIGPIEAGNIRARAALEAAAPHIAAQALSDAVDAFPLETITAPDNAVAWMMRRTEQIRSQA